ncbi:helix-turn-helix transcriptional regulator [Providencia rettgeri]|uniref:helix-turn-helix transcriptional regulator n=1 Tax=unclassified Providencia TaxID=2633465 RepID=UPI0022754D59|nr:MULTISPECIES: hypothetical protein [unclassified Providencia]MDB9566783.1 hypothetical protein [Providencia rettgeri]
MNIESNFIENTCNELKKDFMSVFDWSEIDVTINKIDVKKKCVNIISNNYEWQLIAWGDDLDLLVNERLKSRIQYWDSYTSPFKKTLAKAEKNKFKIDICNRYGDIFEITTINANRQLTLSDMIQFYSLKPILADYSHRIWSKAPELLLPLRACVPMASELEGIKSNERSQLLSEHKYMRFGHIRFTRKEMITIRLLLSHCKVKEISYIQGCSEASENRRIQNIKEKLGCPYVSSSGLFTALKEQGITLACLETLIDLPLTNSIMKNR